MARSTFTIFTLGAVAFLLMSTTGCQEHRRLEAETASAKEKFKELQPQIQQLSEDAANYNKRRNEAVAQRDKMQQESLSPSGVKTLEDEVAELQAEKTRLEKDVKAIEDEHQEYRKSNS